MTFYHRPLSTRRPCLAFTWPGVVHCCESRCFVESNLPLDSLIGSLCCVKLHGTSKVNIAALICLMHVVLISIWTYEFTASGFVFHKACLLLKLVASQYRAYWTFC